MNEHKDLKIDFAQLCLSYNIRVAQEGERHYREDWVCLPCPFCTGEEGNHLGFNNDSNTFSCWRCGRHGKWQTIGALLNVSPKEAYDIGKRFSVSIWDSRSVQNLEEKRAKRQTQQKENEVSFSLPGVRKMLPLHKKYLLGRGFDPAKVMSDWSIRCCGPVGRYAYRIIIPITYHGKAATFTSRDVTGQAADRYLACDVDKAIRHHKHCVYGMDQSPYKTCLAVEGPFGVWRIGRGTVGTCGTGWTHQQAKLIARFRKSYIVFDPGEKEALERAERLSTMLSAYHDHTSYVIEAENPDGRDTGELDASEIRQLRKLLK